jgi:hypothetical protein
MNVEALRGCSGSSREEIAVMGSVLAFQPRDAASVRKPPAAGGTASIVIFPGIRYERAGEVSASEAGSKRTDTKRDHRRPQH